MDAAQRVADAPPTNLVDRFAPASWKPWLRLARYDRPIGSWLLMWPCQWSAALAATMAGSTAALPWHVALFFVGSFVMRGAGSTWNDFLDRDIDGRVERTRNRPIPAGLVTAKQAFAFAVAQSLIGLVVLLQFNRFAILLGILSLAPVAVYPLMKRVMGYPQAVLGLCFAWGALMGFAAQFGALPWPALVLYLGTIAWVIGYDTIYGHQDQRDDAVIGIKSTSRTFGRHSRAIIAGLYILTVLLIGLAIWGAGGSWPSFAGLAAFTAHLAWQVRRLEPEQPAVCLRLFRSNRDAGALLFAGLLLDAVMR
ncbi:4-hydroxybenzoate octaprenyltransferase [Enterovirga rhinocerotis]|uniref:4-hydroxybenzoate octaprenyltransferase n=1 Tax=Enterovirga rhinocerotis TaxID=1339210 RepID=A0A4R7BY52_9HYPH|nr:4-hydroxybenzoate octaprenyltransferase [Enterovirga rhinocerotis]TDR90473.1 4-hydroxybenzoate polyprenyltransferase [Enterovirga rhinocerotis]